MLWCRDNIGPGEYRHEIIGSDTSYRSLRSNEEALGFSKWLVDIHIKSPIMIFMCSSSCDRRADR